MLELNNNLIIRRIQNSDINEICELHKKLFDKSHFTAQFPTRLLENYFKCLLEFSDYALTAQKTGDKKIIGYIYVGGNLFLGLKKFLRAYWINVLWIVIKRPRFWKEKFTDFAYMVFGTKKKTTYSLRIFLIAAYSDNKIKGIGSELIDYFERELIKEKKFDYGLSVRKNNLKAIYFYQKINMKLEFETDKSLYFYKCLKTE